MAEHSDAGDKNGHCPEIFHTFIIEIDRKGSQAQERLKWKWPQSQNSKMEGDNTAVAENLLNFLDTHLLGHEPGRLAEAADFSSRARADQRPRAYSVELHHPALGGWSPLSTATSSDTIPKNCRVHVSVNKKLKAAASPQQDTGTRSASASGTFARALPSLPPEQASTESGSGEMLALPWRRFDQDLGGGDEDGFQICGRRLLVGDVSNSSEGTGLSTWDGSVLLAKYLEHQAVSMRRDFDNQRSRRQDRPISAAPRRAEEGGGGVINATGGQNHSFRKKAPPVVRILELGCGTGLAGLAAAFSFGRRESGDNGSESTGDLPVAPPRSTACDDEKEWFVECAPSPTVEDGVEVVLTDLEYTLENVRANVRRNASSLKAVGSTVNAMELDWCRPLPDELAGGDSFDLILAADVVWLDELVGPLVRTLEHLTTGWLCCSGSDGSTEGEQKIPQTRPAALSASSAATQELVLSGESVANAHANGCSQKTRGAVNTSPRRVAPRRQGRRVGKRVLLAYQWRSQRTGNALLEELEKAFHVREMQPEECHPEYLPSSNLCLFEVVRR